MKLDHQFINSEIASNLYLKASKAVPWTHCIFSGPRIFLHRDCKICID